MDTLDVQVQHVKSLAFATGTFKNRKTQIKAYLLFALHAGFQPLPLTVQNLMRYIVFLARSLKAFSSVRNYIDGLRFYQVISGFQFDKFYQDIQVQMVIKGVKRILDTCPSHTLPITEKLLCKIYSKITIPNSYTLHFGRSFY